MPDDTLKAGVIEPRVCDLTVEEFMMVLVRAQMIADGAAMNAAHKVLTPVGQIKAAIRRFIDAEFPSRRH